MARSHNTITQIIIDIDIGWSVSLGKAFDYTGCAFDHYGNNDD